MSNLSDCLADACKRRWIGVRIDALAAVFSTALAVYLIYIKRVEEAATVGFSLNMAAGFSNVILSLVRVYNEFEVGFVSSYRSYEQGCLPFVTQIQCNSLERLQDHTEAEQELDLSTSSSSIPINWPSTGAISVTNLSARYSPNSPDVLRDLSFDIQSGEHIGIVGRTGSGKSTLALALLRCVPTTGSISINGIDLAHVAISELRKRITYVPQDPKMFSGTLRGNLDPFEEHEDVELHRALDLAGWWILADRKGKSLERSEAGLDMEIERGGSNLSMGQRQIVAIARALLRRSRVVIFDEGVLA